MDEKVRIGVVLTSPTGRILTPTISKEQFEAAYDLKHENQCEWINAIEHLFTSRLEAEIATIIIGGATNYRR